MTRYQPYRLYRSSGPGYPKLISPDEARILRDAGLVLPIGPIRDRRLRMVDDSELEFLDDAGQLFRGLSLPERCILGDRYAIARRDSWRGPPMPIRLVPRSHEMWNPPITRTYRPR